jgi:hypothetical protein
MGEVECLPCVFRFDDLETPAEGNETENRVDVHAELRKRAPGASEDCNESIYARDLIQHLQTLERRLFSRKIAYGKEKGDFYSSLEV